MSNTKTLPTDKNGKIYYGPTTFAAAEEQIKAGRPASDVAKMVECSGYTGVAHSIRNAYGLNSEGSEECASVMELPRSVWFGLRSTLN